MKTLLHVLGLLLLAAAVLAADQSDPVGAFRMRLRGNSDTIVSLPLQRAALVETTLNSRSGTALELKAAVPVLPTEGAFGLVMSGALEGAVLPITSTGAGMISVDAAGFDLSALKTEVANGAALADVVSVVPYWTLDTLFPAGQGVHATSVAVQRLTEILMFDDSITGTNLSSAASYFYFAGSGSVTGGWYQVGSTIAQGKTRIPPHRYFIVRHQIATDTDLVLYGAVQMAGYRIPVQTRTANRDQDNLIALPVPLGTTLGNSRLIESGAFVASTNGAARNDELLVFDNTMVGFNKSAAAVYFYIAGNPSMTTGWYRVGDASQTYNNLLLKPGEGYVVRKRATASPARLVWNGVPTYLQ